MEQFKETIGELAGRTVREAYVSADGESVVILFTDGSMLECSAMYHGLDMVTIEGTCICTTNQ